MNTADKVDITVLMTVYNGARFLRASLESVLNQTFKDFEFLIIDDKSTDESVGIIQSYDDKRIRLISNGENKGQTKSLNIGLEQARGCYIARMDADDLAFPQWLEEVYNFAKDNPKYCVISPQCIFIDEKYRIINRSKSPVSHTEIIMSLLTKSPVNHVGSLMLKQEIIDVGGYDEKFRIIADYELWYKLIRRNYSIMNIPNVLTAIRFHNASVSVHEGGVRRRMDEFLEVVRLNIGHFTKTSIPESDILRIWRVFHDKKRCDLTDISGMDSLILSLYNNTLEDIGITEEEKEDIIMRKQRELCMRKIQICLLNREFVYARGILRECARKNGLFSIFGLLYFMSISNLFFSNMIRMHAYIAALITKFKLIEKARYIDKIRKAASYEGR